MNFDRPLGGDALGWADPAVEQRIAAAATRAEEQARSLGYAAGWAQGRRAAAERESAERAERQRQSATALAQHVQRAQDLLRALDSAARQVRQATMPAWAEVADVIADGALAIARAALGRELEAVDSETADAVRVAVRALSDSPEVTVHVNPQDLALLGELVAGELPDGVRLVADPDLAPGAVLAAGPVQRVRRDLPAAVRRAEEVLRS